MQIIDKRKAMTTTPLLRLGFRPFFLFGVMLATIAIPLWLLGLFGNGVFPVPQGGWLAWHRHELIFGFAGAIISGFLLTAVQAWTGHSSISGRPLGVLVCLWLLGRLSWWLPFELLTLVLNVLFLLVVAAIMGRLLWAVRQQRNYLIVLVLILLSGADALSLLGVLQHNDAWQRQGSLAAIWLVVAMITLIGGRVIPFFTQRGLMREASVQPWPWLDRSLALGALTVGIFTAQGWFLQQSLLAGGLLMLLGLGHAVRLSRWFDREIVNIPLLWSLHLAYAWLVIGCLALGLWHWGAPISSSQALHALTVGSVGGLNLAMLARVSLGHTGRSLILPRGFVLAFVLVNLAALLRFVGVSLSYQAALWMAALCWSLAFAQFLYCYGPMLCRTRADGHPG